MSALERLSKINDIETFNDWYERPDGYADLVSDIEEVVALAKANQQPTIDAMRFEAAKAAMGVYLEASLKNEKVPIRLAITASVECGDLLISELQKPKL